MKAHLLRCGNRLICTLAIAIATFCTAAGLCFAADLPKTAKLVPPQTIALVEIDNYNRFREHLENTSLYRLYKDPAIAAFVEHVKDKWRKNLEAMDQDNVLRALLEADAEPEGRLAAAWLANERLEDTNEPAAVIITQWGQNITKIREAITKVTQRNIEMGGRSRPGEDFRGVTIESVVDEAGTPFSYCFLDDCFFCAFDAEHLRFVVSQIKGASSPTLADDADYSAAMHPAGRNSDLSVYVNIKQMVKMATQADSQGRADAALTNLGLDNVGGLGASVVLGAEPHKPYDIKALLKINGPKKGIFRILDIESAPLRAPRFVPPESCRLTVINLDIQKAYNELSSVLTAFGPMLAAPLYTPLVPASPDGEPAVMLKQDIIDHFGTEILIAQSMKKPFSDNPFPAEYLIAVATTNRGALEKSLATWHDKMIAPNDPEARRELLGHTLYLIRPQFLPYLRRQPQPLDSGQENPPPATPTFAFTLTDTHLICGFESSVEKAVRTLRGGESLSDAGWFNQARALVPSTAGLVSLENTRGTVEFFWWLLQQSKKDPGAAGQAAPTTSYMFWSTDLDVSLLPQFDTVSKYFGLTGFYVLSRDDGFFMELTAIDQPPN